MLTFQVNKIFPLEADFQCRLEGIAFDGCYFYFTSPYTLEILQYDKCFHKLNCFKTARAYQSICYDRGCKCYWASAKDSCAKIFKLDHCFCEIDCINIQFDEDYFAEITGVSCGCSEEELYICFDQYIAIIEKINNPLPQIIQDGSPCLYFTSVQCVNQDYLSSHTNQGAAEITVYSKKNELQLQCCLPEDYLIKDMAVVYSDCNIASIYIIVTKCDCYTYLMKCSLVTCCEESCCCHDFFCSDIIWPVECAKGCNEILRSIAWVENAIAHILNAEGEKIQKILEISDQPDEILSVNDSVNKTIVYITHLEQALYSKMQLAVELCDKVCDKMCEEECT